MGLESVNIKDLKHVKIDTIDTLKEIAKIAGTSRATAAKVKKIKEKAPEEVIQKLRDSEISINQAYITIKREEKEQKRNDEVKENTEKVQQAKSIDELKGLFQTSLVDGI